MNQPKTLGDQSGSNNIGFWLKARKWKKSPSKNLNKIAYMWNHFCTFVLGLFSQSYALFCTILSRKTFTKGQTQKCKIGFTTNFEKLMRKFVEKCPNTEVMELKGQFDTRSIWQYQFDTTDNVTPMNLTSGQFDTADNLKPCETTYEWKMFCLVSHFTKTRWKMFFTKNVPFPFWG